jgi:hypothetical protein
MLVFKLIKNLCVIFAYRLPLPLNLRGASDAKRVARAEGQRKRRLEKEERAIQQKAKKFAYDKERLL